MAAAIRDFGEAGSLPEPPWYPSSLRFSFQPFRNASPSIALAWRALAPSRNTRKRVGCRFDPVGARVACHRMDARSCSGIGSGRNRRMARVVAIPSSNETSGTQEPYDQSRPRRRPRMRAAVLSEVPGKLEIDEVQIDNPGPREVLIRTAAAGLCHSDLHFMEGKYPCPLPAVLGHEAAGVVEKVGDQVSYVKPGDHVITCLSVYCGNCEFCLTGHLSLCADKQAVQRPLDGPQRLSRNGGSMIQFFELSSFAEMMLVHEHAIVKIRDDMPLDRAALIGCGVTTGVGAVFNTAKVEPGSTVAVIGCGGIGLNCIQAAKIAGAGRVIAVDRIAEKLELAKTFGATDVVDASDGQAVPKVLEMTSGG